MDQKINAEQAVDIAKAMEIQRNMNLAAESAFPTRIKMKKKLPDGRIAEMDIAGTGLNKTEYIAVQLMASVIRKEGPMDNDSLNIYADIAVRAALALKLSIAKMEAAQFTQAQSAMSVKLEKPNGH